MARLPWLAFGLALVPAVALQAQRLSIDNTDTNRDGRITRDEYVSSRERQFREFDKNGDGVVSSTDFSHYPTYRRALRKIDRMLATLDADGDGTVSHDDIVAAGTPLFDRADADGNGSLDQGEIASLRKALATWRRTGR